MSPTPNPKPLVRLQAHEVISAYHIEARVRCTMRLHNAPTERVYEFVNGCRGKGPNALLAWAEQFASLEMPRADKKDPRNA